MRPPWRRSCATRIGPASSIDGEGSHLGCGLNNVLEGSSGGAKSRGRQSPRDEAYPHFVAQSRRTPGRCLQPPPTRSLSERLVRGRLFTRDRRRRGEAAPIRRPRGRRLSHRVRRRRGLRGPLPVSRGPLRPRRMCDLRDRHGRRARRTGHPDGLHDHSRGARAPRLPHQRLGHPGRRDAGTHAALDAPAPPRLVDGAPAHARHAERRARWA